MFEPSEVEVFLAGCAAILFITVLNICAMCLGGIVVAWCWNNVFTGLPVITWWQGAIGVVSVRFMIGFFRGK